MDVIVEGLGEDDTLVAGLDADTLTRGTGADIVVYPDDDADHAGAPFEVVTDFESGADKIDVSRFDPGDATPGVAALLATGLIL